MLIIVPSGFHNTVKLINANITKVTIMTTVTIWMVEIQIVWEYDTRKANVFSQVPDYALGFQCQK